MLMKTIKKRGDFMLTRYELFLFNRELLFLLEQHSSCTDFNLKEILLTQIDLILTVLIKHFKVFI